MASDRSSRSAQTTFSVNIIGAGIAGLAAAIPLARKGHTVTIYESNTTLSELGAGLQLTPNATRVLYHWGLESAFLKLANEPAVMKVLRFADASEIGEIALNPQQTWEYGYPHWTCYRPDLQQLLAEAALQSGAKIEFGKRVADVDVEEGTIRFQNGMTTQPDLVVVADGISSKIREKLPGNAGMKAQSRNEYCIRTVIDKEKMDSDPATAELMKGQDSLVWCGPGVCVLAYTVSGGQKYNTLISCPQHSDVPVGRWNERGEPAEAQGLIKDFCPTVRKVWSYVDECVKWELGEVPKVESYASKSGRCVLVGDAAQ
jgi:salicylate hydroxylase